MNKKQLYTLEYPVRCSPTILYDFLSNPSGLQEWFADRVDERDGIYSFSWNGSEETAEVLSSEEEKFIRFHWSHAPKEEFFEFSIEKSEVTNQTILVTSSNTTNNTNQNVFKIQLYKSNLTLDQIKDYSVK